MTTRRCEVVIVGLGAMGAAAAAHLARRGVDVVGLEQFTPAHALGSSHGETRIVRQAYFEHPDYVPLARRAYELWHQLDPTLLHLHGGLMLGAPSSPVVRGTIASASAWSLPHEVLDADELARRFAGFRARPGDVAVFEPIAGYVSPEDGVRAHLAAAAAGGAELRFGTRIDGWDLVGDAVEVTAGDAVVVADRVIVAAGAWAPGVLGDGVPLQPVRRVVAFFEVADGSLFTPARFPVYVWGLDDGDAIYGFPETSPGRGIKVGFHYRGPAVDPDALDRVASAGEIADLLAVAGERFTGLTGTCVDSSVCMYTMTPDEHFVVGVAPGTDDRVVVAAGFSGHGYKFAPVIGEALAELATTGAASQPIEFLSPRRFSDRPGRRRS